MGGPGRGLGERRIKMKSVTKSVPRWFRVGEWVSYAFGEGRILGQIVEDRGLLGYRGRRLHGVRMGWNQLDPRTTEVPEANLEPAPEEVLPAKVALQRGFFTEYWPRLEFEFRYIRKDKSNTWTAMPEFCHVLKGENGIGAKGYATVLWKPEAVGDENGANVSVLLEYDPRLRDPRDHPGLWRAMREEARRVADE
jgi:hypothetical protein